MRLGSGVGGVAVGIEAADIGDADTLGVVAGTVGADLLDRAASVDAAVGVDDIVIADVVPAKALMVAANALHGAVGIGAGGGAMEDTKNGSGTSVDAGSATDRNERFRGRQPSSPSPSPVGAGVVPPVVAGLLRLGLS